MKHTISVCVLFFLALMIPLGALELNVSGQTSSFAMKDNGDFTPASPNYGMAFSISEQIQEQLEGKVSFESDPLIGNTVAARVAYRTSFLEISAGPSFGVLNTSGNSKDIPVLFQPGVGIGFSITAPGIVVAHADTDFALPSVSGGQVYLQKSELSAGFYLPNVLCRIAINQRTNSLETLIATRVKSVTDYGLYTESYKKGSLFRIGVNFIYRISDYAVSASPADNRKIGHLVLGGGLTWIPKNDFNLFIDGNGSLYSFSLGKMDTTLAATFFEVRAGAKIITGNTQ